MFGSSDLLRSEVRSSDEGRRRALAGTQHFRRGHPVHASGQLPDLLRGASGGLVQRTPVLARQRATLCRFTPRETDAAKRVEFLAKPAMARLDKGNETDRRRRWHSLKGAWKGLTQAGRISAPRRGEGHLVLERRQWLALLSQGLRKRSPHLRGEKCPSMSIIIAVELLPTCFFSPGRSKPDASSGHRILTARHQHRLCTVEVPAQTHAGQGHTKRP